MRSWDQLPVQKISNEREKNLCQEKNGSCADDENRYTKQEHPKKKSRKQVIKANKRKKYRPTSYTN